MLLSRDWKWCLTKTSRWVNHPVVYGSWALMTHEKNYHSTKLGFLALKWAIMEHFKEYLLYQPFLVRTDNNPLTYILTTPNLDATGHQWVGALARFYFQLEYQKGWDNTVTDALSQITTHLSPKAVQSVLNGVTMGTAHRAEGHNPLMVEGDHNVEKEVHVTTGQVQVEMHMTDWAAAQKEDLVLNAVLSWLGAQKKTNLRTLLGEHASSKEGWMVWRNHQNFTILQNALYLCSMAKGENEDLLLFVVLKAHWTAALNGCHWDAEHQGCDHTLSLLQECFWWPGMAKQMRQISRACTSCLQYEVASPRPLYDPLWLLLPWISYMLTLQALRPHWSQTNHLESPTSWCSKTASQSMCWHMWPLIKLQRLLPNCYMEDTSLSLGPWPGS